MNSTIALQDSNQDRIQTSRSKLIAAYKRVIKSNGRRQATDLHVRRLLNYVQAKDHDGQGAQRSLEQLAKILFLTVSTCRRVIRRAVKQFGLLTVISQRHTPGGQTVNRYTINWKNVDALLCDEDRENAHLEQAQPVAKDLSLLAEASSVPGSTDVLRSLARSKRILSSTTPTICQSGSDRLAPDLGWPFLDSHADGPDFYDQPLPPHSDRLLTSMSSSTSHRMLSPITRLTNATPAQPPMHRLPPQITRLLL